MSTQVGWVEGRNPTYPINWGITWTGMPSALIQPPPPPPSPPPTPPPSPPLPPSLSTKTPALPDLPRRLLPLAIAKIAKTTTATMIKISLVLVYTAVPPRSPPVKLPLNLHPLTFHPIQYDRTPGTIPLSPLL